MAAHQLELGQEILTGDFAAASQLLDFTGIHLDQNRQARLPLGLFLAAIERGHSDWFPMLVGDNGRTNTIVALSESDRITELLQDHPIIFGKNEHGDVVPTKGFISSETSVFLGDCLIRHGNGLVLFNRRLATGMSVNNGLRVVNPEAPAKDLGYAIADSSQSYIDASIKTQGLAAKVPDGMVRDFR